MKYTSLLSTVHITSHFIGNEVCKFWHALTSSDMIRFRYNSRYTSQKEDGAIYSRCVYRSRTL